VNVGQLAKQAGVNVQTLRYYERRGLLPRPPRAASGYRQYGAEALERVRFIKQAQKLGFSLREAQLILQRLDEPGGLDNTLAVARQKVAELDEQLAALQDIRSRLAELVKVCSQRAATRVASATA
jgi:DNA-binding transcriptional MerR regulator